MTTGEMERRGEVLVDEGVLTQEELRRCIDDGGLKGTTIAAALDASPQVSRRDLAAFLASKCGPPLIGDLAKVPLSPAAAKLVGESLARDHKLAPLALSSGILFVAQAEGAGPAGVQALRQAGQFRIKVFHAPEPQIRETLDRLYPQSAAPKASPTAIKQASSESVPLISMGNADPEEIVEIMEPVKISGEAFAAALKDPRARLVADFNDVFVNGGLFPALRL